MRILPAFQYFRIEEVKPLHIIDFLDNLGEDGMWADGKEGKLSSSTIRYHYRILNNIFNLAVEIKYLKESPLDGVKKPLEEYKEVVPYSLDEASDVISALEGELLHWQITLKLDRNVVKVRDALTYTKRNGYQINEIKKGSRRSKRRDISLPEDLIKDIERLIKQRKKKGSNSKKRICGRMENTFCYCVTKM